jgi:two-component system cell cycle sensor histidine kinase/response regulator CckA
MPSAAPATILLVEDEAAVREMAGGLLKRAGYTILPASSALEALAIFEREQARISLLLTDVVMADLHGPELAERLRRQRPELRVVFISGYSDALSGTSAEDGNATFLSKPFTAATLIATVQGALAEAPALRGPE